MKIHTLVVSILFWSCLAACAQEQIIKVPELDYVRSTSFPNGLIPKSDTVLRLSLDLYGENKPTIFLSFQEFTDRSGHIWTAYTPANNGYQRVDYTITGDMIQFRPDGFYSLGSLPGYSEKGGLFVFYPGKGGGELVHYDIKQGKAIVQVIKSINYDSRGDKDFIEKILKHHLEDQKKFIENHSYTTLSAAEIKRN